MFGAIRKIAIEQPAIFWSIIIGTAGPVMVFTVPKARREYFGFKGYEQLPLTYPLPNRARVATTGYEDSA